MIDTLPIFDVGTLEYDPERYPWNRWVHDRVRAAGYDIDDLTQLHTILPLAEQPKLTKGLIRQTQEPEFRSMVNRFIDEYLRPIVDCDVAVQRFPNVRVVMPDRPDMRLPFHQGIWVGNGWGTGTCWMPVTPAFDSNSMYIMRLEKSKELTAETVRSRWSREKMQEVFLEHSEPVKGDIGQACLFNQGCIHGNVPNTTGVTRASIDFRIFVRDGQFHRKMPGGYFMVGDPDAAAASPTAETEGRSFISYCENNTQVTRGIPIYLQRLAIRDYCKERGIQFRFEHVELEGLWHCPILMGILEHDEPDEVIMFTMFALPADPDDRRAILDAALERGVAMHFVNELTVMRTEADRDHIEQTLTFSADFSSPVPK